MGDETTKLIPRETKVKMAFLLTKSPYNEICGFVTRRGEDEWGLIPIENLSKNPRYEFVMDPDEQLKVLTNHWGDIEGIYHSHPSGNCNPSFHDLEAWPPEWMRYWIVATGGHVREWVKLEDGKAYCVDPIPGH